MLAEIAFNLLYKQTNINVFNAISIKNVTNNNKKYTNYENSNARY